MYIPVVKVFTVPKPIQGLFQVKNKEKYKGDHSRVIFRSSWEMLFFRWCDENPDVIRWSSEEMIIPYLCKTDNRMHRYFPDAYLEYSDGTKYIIEIKPKKETVQPVRKKIATKRHKEEVLRWAKNRSKWLAAMDYAKKQGMIFEVWHEDSLRKRGIKILTG